MQKFNIIQSGSILSLGHVDREPRAELADAPACGRGAHDAHLAEAATYAALRDGELAKVEAERAASDDAFRARLDDAHAATARSERERVDLRLELKAEREDRDREAELLREARVDANLFRRRREPPAAVQRRPKLSRSERHARRRAQKVEGHPVAGHCFCH